MKPRALTSAMVAAQLLCGGCGSSGATYAFNEPLDTMPLRLAVAAAAVAEPAGVVAAFGRNEIVIVGSRGAFDLVHAYRQRQTPADGSANGLQLNAAISLLSLQRVLPTDAAGNVRHADASGYGFEAQTLQRDPARYFGGYGSPGTSGGGMTRLRLLREGSALAGTRVDLPRLGLAGASIGLRWERIAGIGMPALWATLPLRPGLTLQLDAETRFRSAGIGLAMPRGSLQLRTRTLPVGRSGTLGWGWQASFSVPL